jgi:hypothetical protein
MALMPHSTGYKATPKLERELARDGQVSLSGGAYRASVATAGPGYYEAWTDSLPFVYGRPSSTLQGALDNLDAAVREAEERRRAS